MKVSLNWLQEYVDVTLSSTELANRLTMAGIEVKGKQVIGGNWENIVVGQIVAVNPHPNADRLSLPTIDLGTEQHTVVCGAPNLKVGDKVAFARVGAQLIDEHKGKLSSLKSAKIRGVVSSGMVCSERELGISTSHEGILVLPPEVSVGTLLADHLGDVIFDLDVTPNRPDCLSIIGIAREVAALIGQELRLPEVEYAEAAFPIDRQISAEIIDSDLCPRYCASLITGVELGASPHWMQQRLLAGGMHPINNIVDITNYVMMEYGQPLHAFDYQQVRGKKIIVRRATDGEVVVTLDGIERVLSKDTLVIADKEGTVAVAGVMGGAKSEITQQTTSILLEAASFDPASIHYTGRMLRLPSEACIRFERGIRPGQTLPALRRATQLIIQLAGGEAARGLVDVYPGAPDQKPILLSTGQIKNLLDVEFSLDQIVSVLVSLGFDCKPTGVKTEVWVTAPYWRSDIQQAVDLIEEVVRIIGYDKIPTTMLSQSLPKQNPQPAVGLRQVVRRGLVSYGFQEVITYSLSSLEMLNKLFPEPHPLELLRLANPMTADQEYLRPNLRVNLLTTLVANRRHEDGGIRLFELGKVYLPRLKDLPDEPEMVCSILSGFRMEKVWQGGGELVDFFDAKSIVEGLFSQLGVVASFEDGKDEGLYPGRQAAIAVSGNKFGVVGELHPKVLQAFEITETVYLFEINLTALLPLTIGHKMFQPIPRFPTMVRDIALVVGSEIAHQKIQEIIYGFPLVSQVAVFDVYYGEQVPPGKKSYAYRITFQSPTHTLTDEEVNRVQEQIVEKLSQVLGATLRR